MGMRRSIGLSSGDIVTIHYPRVNQIGSRSPFEPRRIEVHRVLDMAQTAIPERAFLDRPFVRRGRWLIEGKDLACGQERRFYWESTQGVWRPTDLAIALIDPVSQEIVRRECRFGCVRDEMRKLADVLQKLRRKSRDRGFDLGVVPYE
jgi:hypothetical protein